MDWDTHATFAGEAWSRRMHLSREEQERWPHHVYMSAIEMNGRSQVKDYGNVQSIFMTLMMRLSHCGVPATSRLTRAAVDVPRML